MLVPDDVRSTATTEPGIELGSSADATGDTTADRGARITLAPRVRPGPLGPLLTAHVIERLLERGDARVLRQPLTPRVRAIAVEVDVRSIDLGGGGLDVALADAAARAIAIFVDHGGLAVARAGAGPTFAFPLAAGRDAADDDPVVRLCRELDDDQLRVRVAALIERFTAEAAAAPVLRPLLIDAQVVTGAIVGGPARVGHLLPGAAWQPS